MICCSVTLALFPCFFLLSETSTMMYMLNPSHFFFQKPKVLLCKFKEEQIFSLGEYVHVWAERREARKLSGARGAKRQRRAGQLVLQKE